MTTNENFKPVKSLEKVTQQMVGALMRIVGIPSVAVINWDIDYKVGRGVINDTDRCLWTKEGLRIQVFIGTDGMTMVTQSQYPDPFYKKLKENNITWKNVGTEALKILQ